MISVFRIHKPVLAIGYDLNSVHQVYVILTYLPLRFGERKTRLSRSEGARALVERCLCSDERAFNIEPFSDSIIELQSWKGVDNGVDSKLFSTFCVNVKMQYTLNQRLFLVKQYWITNSITATQRAYQREFGVRNPPKRNTILGLVNKLETTGSLMSEKGKHRSSRIPAVVVDELVAIEISGFDNAGLLSLGLLKRQGLRHTSPDIGRSEAQHHTGDSSY
ncbi:hypothetical protein ANN_13849 [Periplaneta americana]|uniref:DUF4817 domain-containing protein n=1 Tax=Periplaneta americana TaxID=6978 RepID=A0ABQ8SWT6_PERAM|nr:hypothetical protein ANN_13849 [Periplaneta americana]